jgi:hypothetical protein
VLTCRPICVLLGPNRYVFNTAVQLFKFSPKEHQQRSETALPLVHMNILYSIKQSWEAKDKVIMDREIQVLISYTILKF